MNTLRAERPKNYVSFPVNGKILFVHRDQTGPEAHSASHSVCIRASLSGSKVAGREAGQSSASDAEFNPYPTAFPYGNGMVLHFYQQQESSTTKTVHKVINKRLKTYVLCAEGRQHRGGCITPQAVTHSLVLLKMGKIISRNMLS